MEPDSPGRSSEAANHAAVLDPVGAWRRYRVALFNYFRRCGVPPEAAEELTQSIWVVLLERPDNYDARRAPLANYLFGIARHLRLAWDRSQRAEAHAVNASPHEVTANRSPTRAMDVRAAVLDLKDEFRETLVLREFHGFAYDEIAALQGVPIGTVRSRLARARDILRERLRGG